MAKLYILFACWSLLIAVYMSIQHQNPSAFWFNRGAPMLNLDDKERIKGKFIVTFSPIAAKFGRQHTMKAVDEMCKSKKDMKMSGEMKMGTNDVMMFTVTGADESDMKKIGEMPGVLTIEADTRVKASQIGSEVCNSQATPPVLWGLDRIDQPNLPLDGTYKYNENDGNGVTMYFIDSGIQADHPDFQGRVSYGATFCDICTPGIDEFQHGTPVAGVALSASYGVAKSALGVDVQVLDAEGIGETSDVVRAIEWIIDDHKSRGSPPAVVTMSFGGPFSISTNTAVGHAKEGGLTIVAAASNQGTNACFTSPASAPSAITVGCFDVSDTFCDFSETGSCINILAPGVNIASPSPNNSIALESGNSFAAPFVSGVAARYLSGNPTSSPHQVEDWIIDTAVEGLISNVPQGTCNRVLQYPACDDPDDYVTDDGGNMTVTAAPATAGGVAEVVRARGGRPKVYGTLESGKIYGFR